MIGICPKHGQQPYTTPVAKKQAATPRCVACLAVAVERRPRSFVLTQAFFDELRPFFKNGIPRGLRVL